MKILRIFNSALRWILKTVGAKRTSDKTKCEIQLGKLSVGDSLIFIRLMIIMVEQLRQKINFGSGMATVTGDDKFHFKGRLRMLNFDNFRLK